MAKDNVGCLFIETNPKKNIVALEVNNDRGVALITYRELSVLIDKLQTIRKAGQKEDPEPGYERVRKPVRRRRKKPK